MHYYLLYTASILYHTDLPYSTWCLLSGRWIGNISKTYKFNIVRTFVNIGHIVGKDYSILQSFGFREEIAVDLYFTRSFSSVGGEHNNYKYVCFQVNNLQKDKDNSGKLQHYNKISTQLNYKHNSSYVKGFRTITTTTG